MKERTWVHRVKHIPHHLPMLALHMPMQIWPAQASHIATLIRAIVPEQQDSIFENFILLILDTQVLIDAGKVLLLEVLKSSCRVVGEDHKCRLGLLNPKC